MKLVVRLIGAPGYPSPHDGLYLISCDVDANDGLGEIVSTPFKQEALHFDNLAQAMEYWRRQSRVRPFRDSLDGRPNRPLTAYSIEFEKGEEEVDAGSIN